MANNIQELRLAFLLSQREFARLIGIYPDYVSRLESGDRPLTNVWIDAVSDALGVPRVAVTAPEMDLAALAATLPRPAPRKLIVCPIAARHAILALVAKLGGVSAARHLNEDNLADAVRTLIAYVDDRGRRRDSGPSSDESASRLSQGLQITALTILQSCPDEPPPDFQRALEKILPGAVRLIEAFSRVDEISGQEK
jgi:transcriptional regulator with XRE-family HTH domain